MTLIVTPIVFLLLAGIAALAGAIAATLLILPWFKDALRAAIASGIVELQAIPVREVNLQVNFTPDGEDSRVISVMNMTGNHVTAHLVEQWLQKNDLVMMPKGHEFNWKVKP